MALITFFSLTALPLAQDINRPVVRLVIDGPIGPPTAEYVSDGIAHADRRNASLLILQMDTPGGLSDAMRDIIQDIISSPVPIATYVGPSGARAASAGTYILYASHIAAMAPGTNLGAATPVRMGGDPTILPETQDESEQEQESTEETGPKASSEENADTVRENPSGRDGQSEEEATTPPSSSRDALTAKSINDAAAYIRGLAAMRGRNAEWAEKAVRDAASLASDEALAMNVIDIQASSVSDLLGQIDGRSIAINEETRTLNVKDSAVVEFEMDWRLVLLSLITQPNIALILMMIGTYGLLFEFYSPGALVPGVLGAISLLLGLYALNVLPVNYAGLGLMALGLALMVAEAFAPSFGILGLGGIAAFIFGGTFLFDMDAPGFTLNWQVIAGTAVTSGLFVALIAYLGVGAHRRKVASGEEEMIGLPARVIDWNNGRGRVHVHGEDWQATGANVLTAGQMVTVKSIHDLVLTVEADGT